MSRFTKWLRSIHWHNGKGSASTHDGCSFHSTCSKCGKAVMLDSQGNWFAHHRQPDTGPGEGES